MIRIKKIGLMFFCLLGVFVLVACHSKDLDDENEAVKCEQTVIVFFPWSGNETGGNSLYSAFLHNLVMMEKAITEANGLGGTRLLVYIEHDADSGELKEMTFQDGATGYRTWKTYDKAVASRAGGLAELFHEIVTLSPAYHYGMIIGGHGSGWTYMDNWQSYPYGMPKRIGTRCFGSVFSRRHAFSVESLAEALSLTGLHMDYILFDVCYMSNIETAYALRGVTNYLVASTSEILSSGMPYDTMLPYLLGTPDYDSACRQFYEFYSNYHYPYGTIATIDCRHLDRLASIMKVINTYALSSSYNLDDVQILDGFTPCIFYDLVDYVDIACKDEALKDLLHQELESTVPYKYHTPTLLTVIGGTRTVPIESFCGLSISDPSTSHVAVDGRTRTAWYQATH